MDEIQKQFQAELETLRSSQKEYQKYLRGRQQLEAQITENKIVKDEFALFDDDTNIFKQIGPALIKHDLSEAKANVDKRLAYIEGEIKRHEEALESCSKRQTAAKAEISKLQAQVQQSGGGAMLPPQVTS